jgi:hypothetical protein
MVIPQFGMIIRLSQHRWFYKLESLVVLPITCLCTSSFSSTSLIHLLELCKLHLSLSPISLFGLQCSSSCWVEENIWSISLTLLAHCDLLSFVDEFRVGSSITKGNIWRGSRREYKEFKTQKQIYVNRNKILKSFNSLWFFNQQNKKNCSKFWLKLGMLHKYTLLQRNNKFWTKIKAKNES